MTVFEKFKSMSIDEFAEFLDKHGNFEESPWLDWFDKTYCDKCPVETVYCKEDNREMKCAWCELHNKCKFFQEMNDTPDDKQVIKLWLEREYKDETNKNK